MISQNISVLLYVLIEGKDGGKVYWKFSHSNSDPGLAYFNKMFGISKSGPGLAYFNKVLGIKLLARFGIKTISPTWFWEAPKDQLIISISPILLQ